MEQYETKNINGENVLMENELKQTQQNETTTILNLINPQQNARYDERTATAKYDRQNLRGLERIKQISTEQQRNTIKEIETAIKDNSRKPTENFKLFLKKKQSKHTPLKPTAKDKITKKALLKTATIDHNKNPQPLYTKQEQKEKEESAPKIKICFIDERKKDRVITKRFNRFRMERIKYDNRHQADLNLISKLHELNRQLNNNDIITETLIKKTNDNPYYKIWRKNALNRLRRNKQQIQLKLFKCFNRHTATKNALKERMTTNKTGTEFKQIGNSLIYQMNFRSNKYKKPIFEEIFFINSPAEQEKLKRFFAEIKTERNYLIKKYLEYEKQTAQEQGKNYNRGKKRRETRAIKKAGKKFLKVLVLKISRLNPTAPLNTEMTAEFIKTFCGHLYILEKRDTKIIKEVLKTERKTTAIKEMNIKKMTKDDYFSPPTETKNHTTSINHVRFLEYGDSVPKTQKTAPIFKKPSKAHRENKKEYLKRILKNETDKAERNRILNALKTLK